MRPTSSRMHVPPASTGKWAGAVGLLLVAGLLASSAAQTWLSARVLATNFVSPATWMALGPPRPGPHTPDLSTGALPDELDVPFSPVAVAVYIVLLLTWIGGSLVLARRTGGRLADALATWGIVGSAWFCLVDLWEWFWIAAGVSGWQSLSRLLAVTPQFWLALCISGWIATLAVLSAPPAAAAPEGGPDPAASGSRRRFLRRVWLACGVYILVYTTLNWRLYFNLLIPHGDSAMYEEHLWNLLHGKGFRSYLDQGLFLGEHIQFVHLLLIPLYVVWPSHLLLELAESTALALGAFPVFWMTRRHTQSDRTALAAAVAYLLYTPMQFLDIEIDLKTFRPEALGIPLLLVTLDQLDRRHWRGLLIGLALTLTVKEDYALVFGPLGLWIAWTEWRTARTRTWIATGLAIAAGSAVYLWLATRVVIPWFRSGAEVHYARYFSKFGETPEQIVHTMFAHPALLFGELVSIPTVLYAIAMLAPLACLPLLSPGRLAVGAPLFGILCLNELARDPRHHFHAPLVPLLFWATAAGVARAAAWLRGRAARRGSPPEPAATDDPGSPAILPRTLLWASALATGLFFSMGPLGIPFWDPGSNWYWHRLYGPSRRAAMFAPVPPLVPQASRVASTDFVHPRFTHHERSYDYSDYRRKISDYERRVPDDTDFIVIDTQHPYSRIKRPDDVPEYHDRDRWELLPDQTDGYYIVLKRRR